jgi:hypothetical protein
MMSQFSGHCSELTRHGDEVAGTFGTALFGPGTLIARATAEIQTATARTPWPLP